MMRRTLLFLALIGMASATAGSAQTPSFSSRIELIRVDALVTRNGTPVAGLGPDDFEVRDNGVPRKVDLVSFDEIPLNVVLALDMSASLDAKRLDHLRSAGKMLLNGLKETDQAALVTFSHLVSGGAPLTSDFDHIRAALDETAASGQTSLIDATFTGTMIGESDVGRSLLLVFSDGVDSASWLTADAVLDTAKRSDIVVYGVEVGQRRLSFLRDLSAATGGRLIEIESTEHLDATFRRILEEFRHRYLISFSPQGVSDGGWHELDVRVKGRGLTVRARPGYLSEK
jgi:Ca-activated chloride channel family protein